MEVAVYVGYDERQDLAFKACRESIYHTSTGFSSVLPVCHKWLRLEHMFNREWTVLGDGVTVDKIDGRPFSTNFAFTRFLVPHMAKRNRHTSCPVVFVDSDFIFIKPIEQMIRESDWKTKAVSVVKHNYTPLYSIKMDRQPQNAYNRKLWSSLMIFNMDYFDYFPSVKDINTQTGKYLHEFEWIKPEDIGNIPENWNYIPDHSNKRIARNDIGAVHYTEGTFLTTSTNNWEDKYLYQSLVSVLDKAKADPSVLRLIS